jgi:hypothetical protein
MFLCCSFWEMEPGEISAVWDSSKEETAIVDVVSDHLRLVFVWFWIYPCR